MKELVLVIPAFNEAMKISDVVLGAREFADVIVIDDGSVDATAQLAEDAGALVIKHTQNRGYEAALNSGILAAKDHGYVYALTLDADGQHDPLLINDFIQGLDKEPELIIGHRDKLQRWSEVLFACVSKILWGVRDPLCGMKLYRLDWLNRIPYFDTKKLVGTELAIKMIVSGASFQQVPIRTRPRFGESRFGEGIKPNIKILRALMILLTVQKRT